MVQLHLANRIHDGVSHATFQHQSDYLETEGAVSILAGARASRCSQAEAQLAPGLQRPHMTAFVGIPAATI